MATAQKTPLRALTTEEQAALDRLEKASSERVDRVRRARALLAVARGDVCLGSRTGGVAEPDNRR